MTALTDLPVSVNVTTRTRDQHATDHERLHLHLAQSVYSADYGTLQDALDDAVSKVRPLVIAPGTHVLTSPLLLNHVSNVNVFAYGATLQAGADMAALLEMRDTVRCSWFGGWFNVPTGRVVDNAVYVYTNTIQSTRNTLSGLTIEGDYSTGLRIGKQGVGTQCDHQRVHDLECIGRGLDGQVGLYIGDGVNGNCLNHAVTTLMCSNHDTHIVVDRTNVAIDGAWLNGAAMDVSLNATRFSLRNVRSEGAGRFVVTGGPAGFAANLTFADIEWNGEDIAADGEWLRLKLAGFTHLSNVRVQNAAHPPVVAANPGATLLIRVDGLTAEPAYADAFDLSVLAISQLGSYVRIDGDGAVVGVTI